MIVENVGLKCSNCKISVVLLYIENVLKSKFILKRYMNLCNNGNHKRVMFLLKKNKLNDFKLKRDR